VQSSRLARQVSQHPNRESYSYANPKGFLACHAAGGCVKNSVPIPLKTFYGNVEKSRQRRSRHFAMLTYSMYAPRVKMAAALLDRPFGKTQGMLF